MDEDFWSGSANPARLDVRAFLDSSVTDHLAALLDLGVLLSLGLTRDGGAVGIAVFDDGRRRREYFRHPEEATDWLGMAVKTLSATGLGDPADSPRSPQKPTRGGYKDF